MNGGSDRQAYDRGVSVFSPDGRLYQVEYAREAVRNGTAVVGVCGSNGVVLAADARTRSPLLADGSVEKLHDVDGRLGAATAGHVADGRRLVEFARRRAQTERLRYDEPIDVASLSTAVADHVQEATQAGGTRPFGAGLLVAGTTSDGPGLFEVDPSGSPSEWHATAIGGGATTARERLEDGYDRGIDVLAARDLALSALAETVDDGFAPADVSVAVLDGDGYRSLDDGERASALDEAGVRRAS